VVWAHSIHGDIGGGGGGTRGLFFDVTGLVIYSTCAGGEGGAELNWERVSPLKWVRQGRVKMGEAGRAELRWLGGQGRLKMGEAGQS